jgi:thiamine biosynthesis protein ThiS
VNCTVNGKVHELEPGETVGGLLERLGLEGRYTLVEVNGEALERARYAAAGLADGDVVVVARPVAGG